MEDQTKRRIGIYFDNETIRLSDAGVELTGTKNRSEFLEQAVKYYTAVLMKDHMTEVLTPALESVIRGAILDTENRLAKILFKDGVAIAMMMHVMATCYDIDPDLLNEIRSVSVKELSRLNGKFKFEDAVNYEG